MTYIYRFAINKIVSDELINYNTCFEEQKSGIPGF